MSKYLTILLLSVVVSLTLAGTLKATTDRTSNVSPLEIIEPTLLDLHVEKLAFQESSGRENIKHLDTNNRYSYGCLQYQQATWETLSKKYGIEADIMDCQAQKELTKLVLTHEKYGWRNWYTSHRKIGLPPT